MTADKRIQSHHPLLCSVVVTTWQRPVLLRETLNSLLPQSYREIEVIVVCDGDDEDVRSISQDYAANLNIRWIYHTKNRGVSAARNTGACEARGDILLFLDDDVVAAPELVATHMRHHRTASPYRRLAVWSPTAEERHSPLTSFVNHELHQAWKNIVHTFAATLSTTGVDSIGEQMEKSACFGLNCSIRRDLFLSLGGFTEHVRAVDEDMEAGIRFYLAGVEYICEPRMLLTHRNSKDWDLYLLKCWRASGERDTYLVFELGQRNAQTRHLVSMFDGYLMDRLYARFTWHLSGPIRSFSRQLHTAANRQRSKLLFGIWSRLARPAEYWSGVKDAHCSLDQLRKAAAPPKTALMLHSIAVPQSTEEATYYISPRRFRRFMNWFHLAGYKTARLAEWLQDEVPPKHLLMTFDDAYDDLYDELFPLVIERRYTPVIYLVADRIGSSNIWDQATGLRARNLLTLDQIREMQKYGVEFGSHTLTHPWLPGVSDEQLRREVSDSKHKLEDLLGVEINSFAYPSGGVDRRVRSAVAAAGYKLAFSILPGSNAWNDPLCQRRADVNDNTSILDFATQLHNGYSFIQSISARLKHLEQELPTQALRSATRNIRKLGHRSRLLISSSR